jgi:hypothetical protein
MTSTTPPAKPHKNDIVRDTIAARLTRIQCERSGGCTRRCRRRNRCVVADEFDPEYRSGRHPSSLPPPAPARRKVSGKAASRLRPARASA